VAIPGLWLLEGGQSSTGSLIDHVIFSHAGAAALVERAKNENTSVYSLLNNIVKSLQRRYGLPYLALLTQNLHMLPDFHGNRSPRADPQAVGVMSGLKLATDMEEHLALHYYATLQAIAYSTRHIIQSMNEKVNVLLMAGDITKNKLFVEEHADITGCRVVLPRESDALLLGTSILAAVAGKEYPTILGAMNCMCAAGDIIEPAVQGDVVRYHNAKYQISWLCEHELQYRKIMSQFQ